MIEYNLRRGTSSVRSDVRQLLCLLTKDNPQSTEELNHLILQRVILAIRGHLSNLDFVSIHCFPCGYSSVNADGSTLVTYDILC